MDPLPSPGFPPQSSPALSSDSNSELSSFTIQRQGHATANALRSSKERFIFNPITLQSQSQSNSRDSSTQSLNKSVEKTSRFTNLTKMLPKRPPSPTLSNSEPPSSPPPPVPTSNPPNMFPSTKRSSLTGVINFPGLERMLSNKKTDSKPPSTPPSPQTTPAHNTHSNEPKDLSEELHLEMETMLDVFNQERTAILQEMRLVKGLWLKDRKKAKRDMEQHAIRISNSLRRYDSLVVEMARQFSAVANELNHLKENQRRLQNEMHRKLEAIRSDLAQFKGNGADQMLSPELKESSESLNIPPAHATMDKSIGRTTSVDSNMQKLSGNRLSKLGKRFSQSNLAKEEGSNSPKPSSDKSTPPSGKARNRENESRTVNKKKIEKFFGETPPHTEDLSSFLTRLGYERYLVNFEKEEITLSALFHMSEEHLICLNIPMGPRLIILREAYDLAKVFKQHNINTA